MGNVGPKERELYGKNNWYDWNIENIGSKWRPSNGYYSRVSDTQLSLRFETPWSTPFPLMEAFYKKYKMEELKCEYADEDMGYNCGTYGWNEDGYFECYSDVGSDESYKFACEVWGYEPEEEEDW